MRSVNTIESTHIYATIYIEQYRTGSSLAYDDQQMLAQSHGTNVHDVAGLPCSILNDILGKVNPSPHKVHFGLLSFYI